MSPKADDVRHPGVKVEYQFDNEVPNPEPVLEPAQSVLTYHFAGGEWAVSPRELAQWFERIGDLVDAGLPGSKVRNVTFDRNAITVELR